MLDHAGMIAHDSGFHNLIAQATNNRTLSVLMETITNSLLCGWKATLHIPSRVENTGQEHAEILDAIESGSADEASRMMKIHLENALDDLQKHGIVYGDMKRPQHTMHEQSSYMEASRGPETANRPPKKASIDG